MDHQAGPWAGSQMLRRQRQTHAAVEKKERHEAEEWTPIVTKFVAHQVDAKERAEKWKAAVEAAVEALLAALATAGVEAVLV
jgi:hypothetical protein